MHLWKVHLVLSWIHAEKHYLWQMLNHDSLTDNLQGDNCSSVRVETVHSLLPKAIELVWLIESDTFIFFTRTSHICTYLFPLISHKCILLFEKKWRQRHGRELKPKCKRKNRYWNVWSESRKRYEQRIGKKHTLNKCCVGEFSLSISAHMSLSMFYSSDS